MITKFLLIVWIGFGNSQSMSIATFDTEYECVAVASAVSEVSIGYTYTTESNKWPRCIAYEFQGVAK